MNACFSLSGGNTKWKTEISENARDDIILNNIIYCKALKPIFKRLQSIYSYTICAECTVPIKRLKHLEYIIKVQGLLVPQTT